jgi:hypothetical protein
VPYDIDGTINLDLDADDDDAALVSVGLELQHEL